MRNTLVFGWLSLAVLTVTAGAQQTTIVPQVRTKPTADSKITAIELAAHFVTAIRVPEPVNSVVVGDPTLFLSRSSHRPPAYRRRRQRWRRQLRVPRERVLPCYPPHLPRPVLRWKKCRPNPNLTLST